MLKRIADYSKSKRGNVVLGTSIQMLSVFVLFIKQIAMVPLYLATIDIATYGAWIAVQGVVGIFTSLIQVFRISFAKQLPLPMVVGTLGGFARVSANWCSFR